MKKLNNNKSLVDKKWGEDEPTLLRTHQMIILPTIRYGNTPYGSASPTTLKTTLCPPQEIRLAQGTFAICRTKYDLQTISTF
jgi:hypothetical protein